MKVEASTSLVAVAVAMMAAAGAASGCGGTGQGATPTTAGTEAGGAGAAEPGTPDLKDPREVHLANIHQLTRNLAENAEAYWSWDGTQLIFQSSRAPYKCDQIYKMPADGSGPAQLLSTGKGRTTCSYFFPGDQRILYSSTHLGGDACPPEPDRSHGYVWALYDSYDIFTARPDGSDLQRLTDTPGYDAEATICQKDGSIVFTSTRDGDIDLYRMDKDGKNVQRLTDTPGYDGGPYFSADCSKIVWRASRPKGKDLADFKALLAKGLVRPTQLEIYVANADGSGARQVTYLGAASFAPYFYPDGKRIMFASNYGDPQGREFDLYAVNTDGTDLERITYKAGFDGFPMFSPDGKKLAFESNRNSAVPHQTDIYVADWVDAPGQAIPASAAADRYMNEVAWLADDKRDGRGIGTAGIDAAADWLAAQMKQVGLAGGAGDGSFFQPLEVPTSVKVGQGTSLMIDGKAVPAGDFVPTAFSARAEVAGRTVAVGYGISAKDKGHDDWGKKKLRGRIAVVKRFVPPVKAFSSRADEARYSDLVHKAVWARQHGAGGMIVVDDHPGDEAPLPALFREDLSKEVGIPVVVVKRAEGKRLLRGSHKVAVQVALDVEAKPTRNVIGVLRATSKHRMPGVLVVGAHYDHLGMGGPDALDQGVVAVHNGADDNASGTAAVLEIARHLVGKRAQLDRDIYLINFTGEEEGLLGSKYFMAHLPAGLKKDDIAAMINLDMVGRMKNNRVDAEGVDTAAEWESLVKPACAEAGIDCKLDKNGGWGPSDQSSFYGEKIPVLYFFTGNQPDYHKATDDADKINAAGGAQNRGGGG